MKRLLLLGITSFGFSLLGLYLVSREALLDPAAYRPEHLAPLTAVAAAGCFAALWLLPSWKMQLLTAAQGFRLSAWQALLAHVATVFGAAMTPSGSGGGPALVLALQRLGVPLGAGLGVAVQLFIVDLIAFAWLIPVSLLYLLLASSADLPPLLQVGGLLAALAASAGALVLARFPRLVVRALLWLASLRLLQRFQRRLGAAARDYYASARAFAAMDGGRRLALQLVTIAAYLANFLLLWALLAWYGVLASPLDVSAVLSVLTLIGFLVPTPGASGYTEVAVGLAVSGRLAQGEVAAPILVWRLATFYLVYLLGPLSGWWLMLARPPRWLPRRRR